MGKRSVAALAVLLMMATACAKTSDTGGGGDTSPGATGEANKYKLQIDSKGKAFNLVSTQYFPDQLTIHPGDSLDFKLNNTGEPHTVTLGTLIDAGLAAADKQPNKGPDAEDPPELKKIPDIFPDSPDPAAPLNQSSAQPCYLDSGDKGDKLGLNACPKKEEPEFNGKQALFNSGYLTEDQTFSMKFAKDTAPGTYSIMCLVHRSSMRTKVNVVAAGAKADTPEEVTKKADEQVQALEKKLTPAYEKAEKGTADNAVAGVGEESVMNALDADFGPKEVSVKTGGTVSWNVFLFHTITLEPSQSALAVLIKDSDGSVKLNQKAGMPAGGAPKLPDVPQGPPPAGPPPPGPVINATYDGSGFFNSGILASTPPSFWTYKIKFTKAGTYNLQCLIHPDMKGKVKVT